MPQNRLFNPFYESLKLAIPLTINQRNLEGQAALRDKIIAAQFEIAAQKTKQDAAQLQAEKDKATATLTQKNIEHAIESQDPTLYQALAPQLEKVSGIRLPVETQEGGLERYVMPKAKPEKSASTLSDDIKEYNFASDQFKAGNGPDPGPFSTWIKDIKKASKQDVNITLPGNQPAEKAVKTQLQKDIVDNTVQLSRLKSIKDSYKKEFLQASGKVKGAIYRVGDFMNLPVENLPGFSSEDKNTFLGKRTEFETQVGQIFNLYRKDITGAAAAVQELDRLKKDMMNVDMTPMQFEHAANAYEKNLKRAIRLKNKVLREGFDVRDESGGGKLDTYFLGGEDDNVTERGEELKAQYKKQGKYNDDQIRSMVGKQLEAEGYFE